MQPSQPRGRGRATMWLAAAVVSLCTPLAHASASLWTITDLGSLVAAANYSPANPPNSIFSSRYSAPLGINESGQVVGESMTWAPGLPDHGFLWQGGTMTDLGAPVGPDTSIYGAGMSSARGINDQGQIVINTAASGLANQVILRGADGATTTVNGLGRAWGINNLGQVIGETPAGKAAIWQVGQVTLLGSLGGSGYSDAIGINNAGQVVGQSSSAMGQTAFIWQNGVMTDLGDLAGNSTYTSVALAINDAGTVVGSSRVEGGARAFSWRNGQMSELPLLAGDYLSAASSINGTGQIVGYSRYGDTSTAVMWEAGQIINLNSLAGVAGKGWNLVSADAINDAGQIVGVAFGPEGAQRAYMLTPVPEPDSVALAFAGMGLILVMRLRRKRKEAYDMHNFSAQEYPHDRNHLTHQALTGH